jgi:hypothetical protein
MKFPYTLYVTAACDTGEPIATFRPELTLRIYGTGGHWDSVALVDTGSDNTLFSSEIAKELGIETTAGQGPSSRAFGGQYIPVSYAEVQLELSAEESLLRWNARVYFADFGSNSVRAVAGHDGFLEYFTAIFNGEICELELEPNEHLPVVSD